MPKLGSGRVGGSGPAAGLGRPYWRLWWAGVVDNVGDGAFEAALPLLAASITHDPRLVSSVAAATYLPWLLLSLPAGVLVDRYDRVALMWRSQAIQCVVVAAVAALAATRTASTPLLCAAGFLIGCAETVFGNASQAVLPQLVPAGQLITANARQYVGQSVTANFVGPPVGSALFAVAAAAPFGADAASFAISAALLAALPRARRAAAPGGQPRRTLRQDIAEGLRWLVRHRLLRTLAVVLAVNNFCGSLAMSTLVLLATQTFGLTAHGYGLLLAGIATGGVLGGLVNARIARTLGPLRTMLLALVANAVAYLAAGAAPNGAGLAALLAISGLAATLWNVVTVSLRQRIVPADLLGRVNSVYRMLGWGLLPFGALAGGFVAHSFGLRAPYLVAGALRLAVLLTALPVLVPAIRFEAARR